MNEWIFQFMVKVWRARKHAKAWYRDHGQFDLIQARGYEAEVDKDLRKVLVMDANGEPKELKIPDEQPDEPKQADMFARGANPETEGL